MPSAPSAIGVTTMPCAPIISSRPVCDFRERQQDQEHSGEIDGKNVHGVEREDEADAADHAGRHHARVGELGVQTENTEDEKDKENIGLDDAREKFLPSGKLE